MKDVSEFYDEYMLLENIIKTSTRYLLSKETENEKTYKENEKLAKEIKEYCCEKQRKLEKKCLKKTGKNIHSCEIY